MKKKFKIGYFFHNRFSKIHKRHRFIISAVLSTFMVLLTTFLSFEEIKFFLPILCLAVYFLTYFSLLEKINKSEWFFLFILPIYFTFSFVLFYFLLPARWLTRLPFAFIYAVSIYAILLASNIFNVVIEKNLQLFRAAFSVNYLFITISSYLSFSLLLSFKNSFITNFFGVVFLTFPLAYQFIWAIQPKEVFSKNMLSYAFIVSILVGEIGLFFSFIPIRTNIFALLLTTSLYSLLGIFQSYLEGRLFKERIREFVFVFIFVFLISLLSANWG